MGSVAICKPIARGTASGNGLHGGDLGLVGTLNHSPELGNPVWGWFYLFLLLLVYLLRQGLIM